MIYDSFSDKVVNQGTKLSKYKCLPNLNFYVVLDLYVYEKWISRIFLQNSIFSAKSKKTCYWIKFFIVSWLFTNPALKKHRRPENKFLWDGLFFFDPIHVCVNQKKLLQLSLTSIKRVRIYLTVVVLFPLFSCYS